MNNTSNNNQTSMKQHTSQQKTFDFEAANTSREPEQVARDTSLPPPRLVRPDRQILYPDANTHYDWPDAADLWDRNTLTVDRITDDIDGPAHRFVIKRGDTVEAYMGHDKFHVGEVIGISHARSEVRVAWDDSLEKGGWFKVGAIYPVPLESEVATPAKSSKPLSLIVAEVNSKNVPEGGFSEDERVPDAAPFTFTEFKGLWKKRADNALNFLEYKEAFERVAASEHQLVAELKASYKAPALKALASRFGEWNAGRNSKEENAKSIYRKMLSFFLLDGSVRFSMGESYEAALKTKVRAVTEAEWNEHHKKAAAKQAERQAALSDPQTLYDFTLFVEANGVEALSNEQLARWDALHADLARERRQQSGPTKTVAQFKSEELDGFEFTIKEGYHDKRECPLWIVQLTTRVERTTFMELKTKAKMLGGWYSSFKRDAAGFQFLSEESAHRFTALLHGDENREDLLAARKANREQTTAERLHELATTMTERAETTIEQSKNSLQNTVRRAEMQAGIRGRCYAELALARTLHSLATALSEGKAKYLDGIRHKTHLETLDTVLHQAKWARIRAIKRAADENTYGYGLRVQEEEAKSFSEDDIRFAEYPHPSLYKRHLEDAVTRLTNTRGVKQVAARVQKLLRRTREEYLELSNGHDIKLVSDFLSRAKVADLDTTWLERSFENYTRLKRASIEDLHELRSALREYLSHKASVRGDDPLDVAERELIGKKLPGFFPTPRPVIEEMLEYAGLEPHHTVLEPSCGKGDIVSAVLELYPTVRITAIEQNRTLEDVLGARGIAVEFADFLQHSGSYDRIVMNPPFEQGGNSEIEHIRHAYECLTAGGRVVSVMSDGPFFRSDKKSQEFRLWLDELGAESYSLPDAAFSGIDAFRHTGVRTRLVVIDKA